MKKQILHSLTLLFMAILVLGCNNDKDNENEELMMSDTEFSYHFSGKLNGKDFVYGQPSESTTQIYFISSTIGPITQCIDSEESGITYNSGIYPSFDESLPTLDLEFVRMYLCSDSLTEKEAFNNHFKVKNYLLAKSNNRITGTTGGVGVYYSKNASQGPFYSSYGGDQSTSSFTITSSKEFNTFSSIGQLIEGVFTVKLYNISDPNDVVEIKDGSFKMILSL